MTEKKPKLKNKNSDRVQLYHFSKYLVVGWREAISLPELGVDSIKVKIDTGARTSALHADDIEEYLHGKNPMVRFTIYPDQKSKTKIIRASAPLVEKRFVRDSGGKRTLRPVIRAVVALGSNSWEIEITLINRDQMGFRMLLGREAVRGKLLVHPGKSFLWNNETNR